MKQYHIKYLVREFEKFHSIYKKFKTKSLSMFRYDAKDNKLILQFDSDYPLVKIDYTDENIHTFNRMVNMVITELGHHHNIKNIKHFDDGKFCTFTIIW